MHLIHPLKLRPPFLSFSVFSPLSSSPTVLNLCGVVLGRVQRPNEPVLMGPQVLKLQQAAVDAYTKYLIDLII